MQPGPGVSAFQASSTATDFFLRAFAKSLLTARGVQRSTLRLRLPPDMLKNRASNDVCLLAMTAVLLIGAGLGLRDPWPADEPRFALVAKQMVLSGDWLFPHRGNELYSDKPPMLMWLQALFYTLLGNWRVAFLLPSLLAALGTLACVYDLGRRLWTRRVGLYAAWMLLFTLHFTFQAKKAQIDPLVVFWITLANYGLLRHLLIGPAWRWWTLGWFAAGLGVITKVVGIIALLMLIPAGMAAARGWPGVRVHVRDRRFWLGPLFFFVAIALWFVPMMVTALTAGQPEYRVYLNDILLRQTAKRYASSWDHAQPVWYHLQSMATMWLPTILLLPWAIPAWRRRLKRRDPRYLLPLVWWLLVLVFFTIPQRQARCLHPCRRCRWSAWRWRRWCPACCVGLACSGCCSDSGSCWQRCSARVVRRC